LEDQIAEARSMGLTTNSLPEASLEDVGAGKFQYSSTENVLEKEFFTFLKAGDNIPQKPGCSRS